MTSQLFLRGMPHLCDKMRRLTSKDISKRKKMEEEPAPDFYSLSRRSPLPESSTPAAPPSNAKTLSGAQVTGVATVAPGVAAPSQQGFADVELALLERRRADILERMSSLTNNKGGFQQQNQHLHHMGMQELPPNLSSLMGAVGGQFGPQTAQSQQLHQRQQLFGAGLMNSNMDISKLLGFQNMGGVPTPTLNQGFMGGNTSFNPFQL